MFYPANFLSVTVVDCTVLLTILRQETT